MSFETRELRRAVFALCEDIRNKSNDGSDFDRGMQTAARRIAKEIGGLDLATPAPAQPDPLHVANERGEGEPVAWQGRQFYQELDDQGWGRWREVSAYDLEYFKAKCERAPDRFQLRPLFAAPTSPTPAQEGKT